MDLNTVAELLRPRGRQEIGLPRAGDAFLGGGTWLFSEPQRDLRRLIDLGALRWPALEAGPHGLTIAATCTVAELYAFEAPPSWRAAPLIGKCCRAFLASFKVWNTATVGGNLCLSLPAGPMISLCAALDGICVIWTVEGGERRMPAAEFARGPQDPALAPGEVLRAIEIPVEALTRRFAFRRASLTPLGRSGVLLIGTRAPDDDFGLTITAATRRPVPLRFDEVPTRDALQHAVTSIPLSLYYDDVHGLPDWRRHMSLLFAEEIRAELAEDAP
ncbi:FAD binding domain-containing protein [Ancylobacter sp. G4_0304]|uniref:FAD binding domain-containing protein n=1 Tax=Ancylobacter sp. G4_0304 TaxID=3114289 RepID=UPI0039C707C4